MLPLRSLCHCSPWHPQSGHSQSRAHKADYRRPLHGHSAPQKRLSSRNNILDSTEELETTQINVRTNLWGNKRSSFSNPGPSGSLNFFNLAEKLCFLHWLPKASCCIGEISAVLVSWTACYGTQEAVRYWMGLQREREREHWRPFIILTVVLKLFDDICESDPPVLAQGGTKKWQLTSHLFSAWKSQLQCSWSFTTQLNSLSNEWLVWVCGVILQV